MVTSSNLLVPPAIWCRGNMGGQRWPGLPGGGVLSFSLHPMDRNLVLVMSQDLVLSTAVLVQLSWTGRNSEIFHPGYGYGIMPYWTDDLHLSNVSYGGHVEGPK